MTTLSLPPIVAAGAVTDSLGREWDPLEHPRGRDGKFIHTFKRIRAFLNAMDTEPWMTGEVTTINADGSIRVRIKKTTDPNLVDPSSGKSYVEQQVDITPDLVESINEKAVLNKDPNDITPSVFSSLGLEDEMATWKQFRARYFPDMATFGGLGKVDLDSAIASLRDTLNANGSIEQWDADFKEKKGHDFVRDAAKYMIATRVLSRAETLNGDDGKDVIHSNTKFRAVLEQLGVDPDIIDDTPDGLSGFDELAGRIRAWKNPSTGLDRAPRTPGASREVEFGDDGNRVAFFGKDYGGPDAPMSLKLVDKDGNVDPRTFNTFEEARAAALEPKASLTPEAPAANTPEPPPEPDEIDPDVDVEPTEADLDEIPDDTEEFTDIDTSDVREIAQDIHQSNSEYGETYADSINGIATGVEEGSYSVEEARAELRSLAGEIQDEADDSDDPELERLSKTLRAIADNLGVTQKAELDAPEEEEVADDWTPEQIEVLDEYVSASQDVNDTLRDVEDGQELVGGLKQYVDTMDGIIGEYALTEDTKVYRGLNAAEDSAFNNTTGGFNAFIESLKPGAVIREKGYMSTSLDRDVADRFTKTEDNDTPGVLLEIDAPEGAAALPMDATPIDMMGMNESELLFPRDSRIYVESRETDENGVTVVRARLLGEDEPDPVDEIDIPAGVEEHDVPVDTNPDELMTPQQRAAIKSYMAAGAAILNIRLRKNKSGNLADIPEDEVFYEVKGWEGTKKNVHEMTNALDELTGDSPLLPRGTVLYRGMKFHPELDKDFIEKLQVGTRFTELGFMSTSKDPDVAEGFSNKNSEYDVIDQTVTFALEVDDDNIRGLDLDGFSAMAGLFEMGEQEVLLPRGVQIVIDDVQFDEGGHMSILARLQLGNDDDTEFPGADSEEDSAPGVQEEDAPDAGPEQAGPPDLDAGPGGGDTEQDGVDSGPGDGDTSAGGDDEAADDVEAGSDPGSSAGGYKPRLGFIEPGSAEWKAYNKQHQKSIKKDIPAPTRTTGFTFEEQKALADYQSHYGSLNSTAVNTYMREGTLPGFVTPAQMEERIALLKGAFSKSELDHDVTLYRGLKSYGGDFNIDFTPGQEISDKAFISTTMNPDSLREFAEAPKSAVFEITALAGTPAIHVETAAGHTKKSDWFTEHEILLPPGTKLRFDSVERYEGLQWGIHSDGVQHVVRASIVPDDAPEADSVPNDQLTSTEHTEIEGGPLTGLEREAVDSYTGVGFMDINGFLREGLGEDDYDEWPNLRDDIEGMKSLMARSKLKESVVVYRGISSEDMSDEEWDEFRDRLFVGGVIRDKGFMSTSFDQTVAKQFTAGSDILFEIDVPAGHPAIDPDIRGGGFGGPESEIILGENTKIRITSMDGDLIRASVTYEDIPDVVVEPIAPAPDPVEDVAPNYVGQGTPLEEDDDIAITEYVTSSNEMNKSLRDDNVLPHVQVMLDKLDRLIDTSPEIPEGTKVYRGLAPAFGEKEAEQQQQYKEFIASLVPGAVVSDKGFMSTTHNDHIAMQFVGQYGDEPPTMLEMNVGPGVRGLDISKTVPEHMAEWLEEGYPISQDEQEILFARNSSIRVNSIEMRPDGMRVIHASLVAKTDAPAEEGSYEDWAPEDEVPDTESKFVDFDGDITDDEFTAVKSYQGSAYWAINQHLRGFEGYGGMGRDQTIQNINDVLARSKTKEDLVLYRGMKQDDFKPDEWQKLIDQFEEGSIISDAGFMSTSTRDKIAMNYSSGEDEDSWGVVFEINVPAGTPAIDMNAVINESYVSSEDEIVLPSGTKLQITEVDMMAGNRHRIVATVVGHDLDQPNGTDVDTPADPDVTPEGGQNVPEPVPATLNDFPQPSLTPDESWAVHQVYGYAWGYKLLNPYLHHNKQVWDSDIGGYRDVTPDEDATAQKAIGALDSAFDKAQVLDHPVTVERRSGMELFDQDNMVGKDVINLGYTSTATQLQSHGYGYESKPVLWKITLPPGTKAIQANAFEQEILLNRGAVFHVTEDVTMPNGDRHVSMTYDPNGVSTKPVNKRVPVIPEPEPEVLDPATNENVTDEDVVDPSEWDWTVPTPPGADDFKPTIGQDEAPLADWEKELLGYPDAGEVTDVESGTFTGGLPGPDSEDWENMVDVVGPYRWDANGNKIGIGDKVLGADGLEMTISKFENNNKGVIAIDAEGKKRIRHRKKLTLIETDTPAAPAPTPEEKELLDETSMPEPDDFLPVGDMLDSGDWEAPEPFDFAFQGFVNMVGDGNSKPGDYFYAGDKYHVTYNEPESEYSLWYNVGDNYGSGDDKFEYVDGYPTSAGWPIHDDISTQIRDTIAARESLLKSADDPAPTPSPVSKKLQDVDLADGDAMNQMIVDARAVVFEGWPAGAYVDLGNGFELRFDQIDDTFEVHDTSDGEIMPVGGPFIPTDALVENIRSKVYQKNKSVTAFPPSAPADQPTVVNVDNSSDFDQAMADFIERIENDEYNDGDAVGYGVYQVRFNKASGNFELIDVYSGVTKAEVDTGEDFDTVMDILMNGITEALTPSTPDSTSDDNPYPGPSGNQSVFSSWENDPDTFAYDFQGFVNDISDGNTQPNDYFSAGSDYTVTYHAPTDEFALWQLSNSYEDQTVGVFPNDNDAALNIQNAIKSLEIGAPEAAPAGLTYSWKDELAAVNDIPKNIPGVKKLFGGSNMTEYQLKQYRNAGFALDDAATQEIDTPQWNQYVNKAIYNLSEAGPVAAAKLQEVLTWRTDAINANAGGIVPGNTPAADLALPEGFGDLPPDTVAVYHFVAGQWHTYAVVHGNGEVWFHTKTAAPVKTTTTHEVLKNHPNWAPYGGVTVSAPAAATPGPDLSQPHKMDANGNAMFVGDEVYWTTKAMNVTVTGFEKNDIGVIVTSVAPDGTKKKHAINKSKLILKKSVQHANSQPQNKQGPPNIVPSALKSKKVDPDPSSPWFGKPEPTKPEPIVSDEIKDGKFLSDEWLEEANANYQKKMKAQDPDWPGTHLSNSYTYTNYLGAQKGNKYQLDHMFNMGWITEEFYKDALAEIDKKSQIQADILEENEKAHAIWRQDSKAWRAANGIPSIELKGMKNGVIKLDNWNAMQWMNSNQKPGGLNSSGKLSSVAYSAVSGQKGSNISGELRAGKEKSLDPEWVATHGGYYTLGMDQAMLESPPLEEDFMVTRTLDLENFINPATGKPYQYGEQISNSVGSIQHDWGFAETSVGAYDAGATVGFGEDRPIRMQLRLPKGLRGVWTEHPSQPAGMEEERGFILERGIAYYIHSVNWVPAYGYGNGHWRVDAEVIPKDVNYDQFGHFINENPFFD